MRVKSIHQSTQEKTVWGFFNSICELSGFFWDNLSQILRHWLKGNSWLYSDWRPYRWFCLSLVQTDHFLMVQTLFRLVLPFLLCIWRFESVYVAPEPISSKSFESWYSFRTCGVDYYIKRSRIWLPRLKRFVVINAYSPPSSFSFFFSYQAPLVISSSRSE